MIGKKFSLNRLDDLLRIEAMDPYLNIGWLKLRPLVELIFNILK